MRELRLAAERELTGHILPFWLGLRDDRHGGMFGRVGFDLIVDQVADKGSIATCRSLWTFSSAYRMLKKPEYLEYARHLYQFVANHLVDRECGGVFWSVDYQGRPVDSTKHVYAQSFAVYALSEYHRASADPTALQLARQILELIEERGYDPRVNAYLEQFDRQWRPIANQHLSEHGLIAELTMNTHLHVLEAYTNLYRAWPDPTLGQRLENLLEIFHGTLYDQRTRAFKVFFDRNWGNLARLRSFGHDIEATWLITEALVALNIDREDYRRMVVDGAYSVVEHGLRPDGSLDNELAGDDLDQTKIWWVQAEAIVGFLNAATLTGDREFEQLARRTWEYTMTNLVDPRPGSEWFNSLAPDGTVTPQDIAGIWKCSYHNGRLCLEILRRIATADR
jgi:cellobiose epimerase